jgi:hypothetical protein
LRRKVKKKGFKKSSQGVAEALASSDPRRWTSSFQIVGGTFGIVRGTLGIVQITFGIVQRTYRIVQGTVGIVQGTFGIAQGTFGIVQGMLGIIAHLQAVRIARREPHQAHNGADGERLG